MTSFSDILGSLMQGGMSSTATSRMQNALRAGGQSSGSSLAGLGGGISDALSGLMGGGKGGIGGMLQDVLGDAGKALGSGNKLALGGLGALAGSLLGGGGSSMKGAMGGGIMAMLGSLAYSALKKSGSAPEAQEVPVGLRQPENAQQEEELEQGAELILKAMINAAKADGQIDPSEIQRIIGKLEKAGADSDARDFVISEMSKPGDLDGIVAAAKSRPQLAAEVYAASLLAIEVDTPAERQYLQNLASGLGLSPEVTSHLEQAVGLN
jgi:uncharacterized membrane protein YebE (DUF533 family)